jgi:hypothetical protein
MNPIRTIIAATMLSILSLGAAQAAEQTIKPLQGASFHVGTKHAVAYYVAENSHCKLVLTLAEEPKGDDATFESTRFEAALAAGKSTRYPLVEGTSLEFACEAEAQAMTIKSLEAVAGNNGTLGSQPIGNGR